MRLVSDTAIPRFSQMERDYFEWLSFMPCVISKRNGVQIAHVRYGDERFLKPNPGMGAKPLLPWVVPLSPGLHREQHAGSERAFWANHGFDRAGPAQTTILHHCVVLWDIYRLSETLDPGNVAAIGAGYILNIRANCASVEGGAK